MGTREALAVAIEASNRQALAALVGESGLTSHVTPDGAEFVHSGGLYLAGGVRMRELFTRRGVSYVDAALVAESVFGETPAAGLALDQLASGTATTYEAWIVSLARGRHLALLAPVDAIADVYRLGVPRSMPRDNWARGWSTERWLTDAQTQALLAHRVPAA